MEIFRTGSANSYQSQLGSFSRKENSAANTGYSSIGSLFGEGEPGTTSALDDKQKNTQSPKTQVAGSRLQMHLLGEDRKAPYYHLSKDGIIEYNGVTYVCDTVRNQLHLGDTSDKKNTLTIPLADGGSLLVNRDNIDDLAKSISMFSPEDINRIMRALAQDAKARQMQAEMDDEECAVGEEITEESQDTEAVESVTSQNEEKGLGLNTASEEGEWKSDVYNSQLGNRVFDDKN